jgi:hypothetical protein
VNDTQRLDAIHEYGLCLATHEVLAFDGWQTTWVVHYGDRVMLAPTIREAIDAAVFDLSTRGLSKN